MPTRIRKVEYFYTTVQDRPGEAYKVLSGLADSGVDLLAMTAIPVGPSRTQLALFPSDSAQLRDVSARIGMGLDGPYPALLVQGDDEMGALARVHQRLADAAINVYASTGVTGGAGSYGYLLYVRPDEFDRAARALGV